MTEEHPEKVTLETWVKVTGFVPGKEETLHLAREEEADDHEYKIPPRSPLAVAPEGAQEGDKIPFHPPAGDVELTVPQIGPR